VDAGDRRESYFRTLTDLLRVDGLFRAIASEYADMEEFRTPEASIVKIPSSLVKAFDLTESNNADDNQYFVAIHSLVSLTRL
jgi:hypothetical protein